MTQPEFVDGLWGVGGVWIGKVPSDTKIPLCHCGPGLGEFDVVAELA